MSKSYTKYVSNFQKGISSVLNTKRESTVYSMLPKHYILSRLLMIYYRKNRLHSVFVLCNICNKTCNFRNGLTYSLSPYPSYITNKFYRSYKDNLRGTRQFFQEGSERYLSIERGGGVWGIFTASRVGT